MILLNLLGLWSTRAGAAAPSKFTVQGVLRDNMGALQSLALNVTVRLYQSPIASVPFASYPSTGTYAVMAQNGLFTVVISDPGVLSAIASQPAVWLELDLMGIGTFPRQEVTSQLFALQAARADSLECTGCVSDGMIASGISGSKVSGAVALSTSTQQILGQPVNYPMPPQAGQVLAYDGSRWVPTSAGTAVSSVSATLPLSSTGGTTPNISLTGVVPVANGGTGSATQTFVDLTTNQTVGGLKSFTSRITVSSSSSPGANITCTNGAGVIGNGTSVGLRGLGTAFLARGVEGVGGASGSGVDGEGGDAAAGNPLGGPGGRFTGGGSSVGSSSRSGTGVDTEGGVATGNGTHGGWGVFARGTAGAMGTGGQSGGDGGEGIRAQGGAGGGAFSPGSGGANGAGVVAIGASNSTTQAGGYGVLALGGNNSAQFLGVGGIGIRATGGTGSLANGLAGYFIGSVQVTGNLSKGGGSFKIDHPLDPENKFLYHSFMESPDMKNFYDGVVVLDARGEATVTLPQWFGALNRDFRYQLTCVGGFAPVYIATKIARNQFKIAGGRPGLEVSWAVTGIRQDAFANSNRIPIEENKAPHERGRYLHPAAYHQPNSRSIDELSYVGK